MRNTRATQNAIGSVKKERAKEAASVDVSKPVAKDFSDRRTKTTHVIMGFVITIAIFLLLRVAGVAYFANLFVQIAKFSPTGALDFMAWIGVLVSLFVALLVLNGTLEMDRVKLNFDIAFSCLLTIGVMSVYSYNYVGYNYLYLFNGMDLWQRMFVHFIDWIDVVAVYGLPDIFYFWLIICVIFFALLAVFINLDISDLVKAKIFDFSALRRKREKKMARKSYGPVTLAAVMLVSIAVYVASFFLFKTVFPSSFSTNPIGKYTIWLVVALGSITAMCYFISITATPSFLKRVIAFFVSAFVLGIVVMAIDVGTATGVKILIISLADLLILMINTIVVDEI